MPKRGFNEAERYIIGRWAAAFELEESMESVREKYQQLCRRTVEGFIEAHPGFYAPRLKVSYNSGKYPGGICISKKAWPKKDEKSASGFWIENITLEYLADEDMPPPLLSVWVKPLEAQGEDALKHAKERIAAEAATKFPKNLLSKMTKNFRDDGGYAVAYELFSKAQYLEALGDTDRQRFADLIRDQLEAIVALASVIDEVVVGVRI